jgi:hypothetical protein
MELAGDERAAMETLDVLEHAVIAARKDGWSKIWAGEVGVGIGLSVRGGVTMRLGRLGDAEQSLRTRLSMTWPGRPGHESRLTLARILARQGVMDEALDLGTVAAQALLPVSPRAATAVEELRDTLARAGLRTRGLDYALVANPSDQRPSLDR